MMRFLAHFFSTLFHPLLMVTYSVLITLNFTYLSRVYPIEKLLLVGGAFLFSSFLPALVIAVMVWLKWISDYEVDKKEERLIPYLVTIVSLVFTLCFFIAMWAPYWLLGMVAGAIVALCIGMLINFYWKISAHGIGIGGLSGLLFAIAPNLNVTFALPLFTGSIIAAGLVGTARLILRRHTLGQVLGGFLIGFIFSNIGVLISYYVINKS